MTISSVAFYENLAAQYIPVYQLIFDAVGRRPADGIDTIENFAYLMGAVFDGLGVLARIDDPGRARDLLDAAPIPLIVGLTVPSDAPPRNEVEQLYGSKTAARAD